MRIGIDIGGSHVGVGLINKGVIVNMEEQILTRQDRVNIEEYNRYPKSTPSQCPHRHW